VREGKLLPFARISCMAHAGCKGSTGYSRAAVRDDRIGWHLTYDSVAAWGCLGLHADACAALWYVLQVFGLRPFRIPLRWDFMNRSSTQEPIYSGVT
jgi:hypothetical protein